MTKPRKGATAAKRRPGDRHVAEASMLLRLPQAALDLLTEAAEAEGYPRSRWALETLVATAAHDLGRDAGEALRMLESK